MDRRQQVFTRYTQLFAAPLILWLGILEFGLWLVAPKAIFSLCALICMVLAYLAIIVGAMRKLTPTHPVLRLFLICLGLVPQALISVPFIR